MKKQFELNQEVNVFDQQGVITDIVDVTREPHLYGVTFNSTGKTYVIEAEHIEAVDNRPITERIKTFEDACRELGESHPAVVEWNFLKEVSKENDVIAFLKLRIITAALNEDWKPDWKNENEYKYYPWFILYTEEEYSRLDDDDKERCCRVVGRSNNNACASGGLVYAGAYGASSSSSTYSGSRLAFKTRELALFAGKQFIETWCDFLF